MKLNVALALALGLSVAVVGAEENRPAPSSRLLKGHGKGRSKGHGKNSGTKSGSKMSKRKQKSGTKSGSKMSKRKKNSGTKSGSKMSKRKNNSGTKSGSKTSKGKNELVILHMNDHHSHLLGENFDIWGDDVPDFLTDVYRLRVYYGGFPRLISLFEQIESDETKGRGGTNLLKLHAGDAITGTTFYTIFGGKADADMMARVCFDAFVPGNHEFNGGDQNLADFINSLHSHTDLCREKTPILAANLVPGESSPLRSLMGDGLLRPSTLRKIGKEMTAGIIGVNIRAKTMISSNPDDGTILTDERTAVETEVKRLQKAGASVIIVVTHTGFGNDQDWIATIDGVDVVVGGDSHSLLGQGNGIELVNEPQDPSYPKIVTRTTSDGGRACVVHAWEYAHGLGKLRVTFNDKGDVEMCEGGIVFPFDGEKFTVSKTDTEDYDLSAEEAKFMAAYLEGLGPHLVAIKEDKPAAAKLGVYESQVEVLKQTIIAKVPDDICYVQFPGQWSSEICTAEETAQQGGGACNLVAKAFLNQVKSADLAIQNGGGCRSDIRQGDYSIDNALTLLPFSNTLVTIELTGEEIVQVLEQSLDYGLDPDGSTGAYPYASGLRYGVNSSMPFRERFSEVEVNPRLEGDWMPINLNLTKTYVVVTNSFIAAGRDGYTLFGQAEDDEVTNTYLEYGQTFVDYATQEGTLLNPAVDEYSTKSYVPPNTP